MATHPKGPMALIVEDDPIVRELAAALLEETDLRVVECEDAEQALATLCKHGEDIALIFSDVRLPGLLDGVAIARGSGARSRNQDPSCLEQAARSTACKSVVRLRVFCRTLMTFPHNTSYDCGSGRVRTQGESSYGR